ncbi:MAG: hypothetical protein NVSMB29_04860 [Candidatus Dormibacteria bacterium]
MTTATLASTTPATRPRVSTLTRASLEQLAATEYARFLDLLRPLAGPDWTLPTECPTWDVRAMATHVLGMAEMSASLRENIRQTLAARRRGGVFIDALTALQVQERRALTPAEIVDRFAAAGPRAARGRARTPGFVRRRRIPMDQPVGTAVEPWTFGYLVETILTRDTWMHRIDVARAVHRPLTLTAEHDGVLVADVASEWAARHQQPCTLILTGPAGGTWTFGGPSGQRLELDAIEFCRALSGRGQAAGLLAVQVPF